MKTTWSKQLSVGNRIIDSKHKRLHNVINDAARSIEAGEIAALSGIFELLEDYLHDCFIAEENIAQTIGFDFSQHRLTHQRLLNEFQSIKNELMVKNGTWSRNEGKYYANTLMSCLVKHIEVDGKPFKAVLDTHFYDLKPNSTGRTPS
ncbi:MAG: hypothetical protein K2P67_01755 [Gallionellaceae bacterium]|nr:hypothetical protein [Gallionellaceae bacterium]